MTVYLIMFFLAALTGIISTYFSQNQISESLILEKRYIDINTLFSRIFLWISALPFLYVAGARYRVGTDYDVYLNLQIPQLLRGVDYKLEYEYLYQLLIKFGVSLGNTQWVFILTHVVFLFFLWKSIQDLSTNKAMSIFIFMFGSFYNLSLNTMRQFIAMAVFMYALKHIFNRNFIKYFLWITVAFMFHKTAILFLPLYFLPRLKINDYLGVALVPLSMVLSEIIRKIIVKLTSVIGIYSSYFSGQFDVHVIQWVFLLFNMCILCLIIAMRKFLDNTNSEDVFRNTIITVKNRGVFETTLFNLQLLATIISAISSIIPNSTRIIFMFSIGQIIYVPYLLSKLKNKNTRNILTVVICLIYIIMFVQIIVRRNMGQTLPYNFI